MRTIYLVKVDPNANNNKFYRMIDNGGSQFAVEYGRIGNTNFATNNYSMRDWDKKYSEKIRKGYTDQTSLYVVSSTASSELQKYSQINDKAIENIVNRLMMLAKQSIQKNYLVASSGVTDLMIRKAQSIIADLSSNATDDTYLFNELLVELFTIIPRKMDSVANYTAKSIYDMENIIKREQALLDVMRGQVAVQEVEESYTGHKENQTILEKLGLEIQNTDDEDKRIILKNSGELSGKVLNSWKVTNKKTQEKYMSFLQENKIKKELQLWHGSRNENWWGISNEGLVLHPNSAITGKMFGYGIDFAPSARKSYGYTSCEGSYWANGNSASGYMGLFDVAYGNPYDVYSHSSGLSSMTYENLKKQNPNAHCVHAHAGNMLRNDEIVVYHEHQTTIKYLVEFR